MQLKCEKCGSQEFEARWQGLTYEFRCARSHWGGCTTRLPPILNDKGPYTIIITSLGSDPTRALIALNRRFSHGIRRTREIFSAGEYPLLTSDAYKVWGEAQKLVQEQVPFRIEPEYPYDLSNYVPEHAHEHDWTPIGSSEG